MLATDDRGTYAKAIVELPDLSQATITYDGTRESLRQNIIAFLESRAGYTDKREVIEVGTVLDVTTDYVPLPIPSDPPTEEDLARAAFVADIRALHRKHFLVALNVLPTDDPDLLALMDRATATLAQYPQLEQTVRPS